MNNFEKGIDKLISKILSEEIENKAKSLAEQMEFGEWTEIEVGEELHGGQKKLDVAAPKGKLTAADFKKLRSNKKETKEQHNWEEIKSILDSAEEEAEKKSQDEPTYVGRGLEDNKMKAAMKNKIFGSFSDKLGWFDERDYKHTGPFDFDYDEEEFDEFEPMFQKYGDKTMWFRPGNDGKKFFDMYKEKFGPMKIRIMRDLDEEADIETKEGNAFTKKLKDTPKGEKFKLDGKTYTDNSNLDENVIKGLRDKISAWAYDTDLDTIKKCREKVKGGGLKAFQDCLEEHGVKMSISGTRQGDSAMGGNWKDFAGSMKKKKETKEAKDEKKWIQKTDMKKGALHKKLGVPEDETLPKGKLKSIKKDLMKKAEGDKKLSKSDSSTLKQVNLAMTLGKLKESKNSLRLTEDELIDMIEKIVVEQKVKDKAEKNNLPKKTPEGLKKTEKALKTSKDFGEDYMDDFMKKMKSYLKDSTKGNFEMNPENFPKSNYDLDKDADVMKYNPSDAVEEYIDNFSYPGMTNLVYDEIKPQEEHIDKYLVGDSTTGNAEFDEDGNALGNVVPSEVGKKFKKNYEDNLYGAEQMEVSYKRQPQPVDIAGSKKLSGSLKSIKKSSADKANKIMSQLESIGDKKTKKVNEEMEKMKNLITYNRKTQ